jgi:ElaB/YqjD/DUF883 family membrane-anchored ribosome-binding protein
MSALMERNILHPLSNEESNEGPITHHVSGLLNQVGRHNMESKAAQDDYARVKGDLTALREDLAALTKAVANSQANSASNLKDEISKETHAIFDQLRASGDKAIARATEAGSQTVESVEHKIEERPFLSIILMFLAGIVVGKMLDR